MLPILNRKWLWFYWSKNQLSLVFDLVEKVSSVLLSSLLVSQVFVSGLFVVREYAFIEQEYFRGRLLVGLQKLFGQV